MRILVVSEGKHELGPGDGTGALIVLVTRVLGDQIEVEARNIRATGRRIHGREDKWFKRAVAWILDAEAEGFGALVLLGDRDSDRSRKKPLERAQAYGDSRLPRSIGLAVEKFDAWFLADETALSRVLARPVERQREPERIRDPKQQCQHLVDRQMSLTDFYRKAAASMDLAILEVRCPEGFAPFLNRLRRMNVK